MRSYSYFLITTLLPLSCFAATLTVTNTNDSGTGSLRQFMISAASGDTINFDSSLTNQTITINSFLPLIRGNLTIDASSISNITINGSNASRIFFVDPTQNTVNATFINLSLISGSAQGGFGGFGGGGGAGMGGAIFVGSNGNLATVTIEQVTFQNCSALGGSGGDAGNSVGGGGGGLGGGAGGNFAGGGAGFAGSGGSQNDSFAIAASGGGGGQTGNGGNVSVSDSSGGGAGGGGSVGNGEDTPIPTMDPRIGGNGGSTGGGGGGGALTFSPGTGSPPGQNGTNGAGGGAGNGGNGGAGGLDGGGGAASGVATADGNTAFAGGSGGAGGSFGGGGGGGSGNASGGAGGLGGYGGGGGSGGAGSVGLIVGVPNAFGTPGTGGGGGFGGGAGSGGSNMNLNSTTPNTGGTGGTGGFGGGGGGGGQGFVGGTAGSGGFGGGQGATTPAPAASMEGVGSRSEGSGLGDVIFAHIREGLGAPSLSPTLGGVGSGGGGAGFGGAIFVQNGSTLNIQNSSGFSGNNAIGGSGGAGSFSGGNGAALGKDIFLMSGGTINFNLASNLNIPNPIESDQGAGGGSGGGLTKTGPALLSLNGANTYTGITTLTQGTLSVNGSLITNVIVNGGRFQGNASLLASANLNINAGTVAPGNSIGTINVTGNYAQLGAATYEAEIQAAGQSDLLNITGTASLAGTLDVLAPPGNYFAGTIFTILESAGATTGTFSPVNFPIGLQLQISYFTHSVQLELLNNAFFYGLTFPRGNAGRVAECLVNANFNSDLKNVFITLGNLGTNGIAHALNQLQPAQFAGLELNYLNLSSEILRLFTDHLFELSCNGQQSEDSQTSAPKEESLWVQPFAQFVSTDSIQGMIGYDAYSVGTLMGFDHFFPSNAYLGGAFGYAFSFLDWKHHRGDGKINNFFGGVYGSYIGEDIWADAELLFGINEYNLKRDIHFSTVDRSAKSHHLGEQLAARLGMLYDGETDHLFLQPFGNLEYLLMHQESFKERHAQSLNLDVHKKNAQMLRSELGMRFAKNFELENSCFYAFVSLSWIRNMQIGNTHFHANFTHQDCVFSVKSFSRSVNAFSPSLGFNYMLRKGFQLSGSYYAEVGSRQFINQFDLRLEYLF